MMHIIHRWVSEFCTGRYSYEECTVCGKRRYVELIAGGYQPINWGWLRQRNKMLKPSHVEMK